MELKHGKKLDKSPLDGVKYMGKKLDKSPLDGVK